MIIIFIHRDIDFFHRFYVHFLNSFLFITWAVLCPAVIPGLAHAASSCYSEESRRFGGKGCLVQCEAGFNGKNSINNPATFKCQANGQWAGKIACMGMTILYTFYRKFIKKNVTNIQISKLCYYFWKFSICFLLLEMWYIIATM